MRAISLLLRRAASSSGVNGILFWIGMPLEALEIIDIDPMGPLFKPDRTDLRTATTNQIVALIDHRSVDAYIKFPSAIYLK